MMITAVSSQLFVLPLNMGFERLGSPQDTLVGRSTELKSLSRQPLTESELASTRIPHMKLFHTGR